MLVVCLWGPVSYIHATIYALVVCLKNKNIFLSLPVFIAVTLYHIVVTNLFVSLSITLKHPNFLFTIAVDRMSIDTLERPLYLLLFTILKLKVLKEVGSVR